MKKFIYLLVSLIMLLSALSASVVAITDIEIYVDEKNLTWIVRQLLRMVEL